MTRGLCCLRALFLALVLSFACLAGLAHAQETVDGPDYETWTTRAENGEDVLESGRASVPALEELRLEVAAWREQFLAAQSTNSERIATLQSQLDALGEVPENGEEPDPIANRRQELTDQLTRLRAPVLRAEEAYTRADGLVREIDNIIRERQTDALLELGPSPLNPTIWPVALSDLRASLDRSWIEIKRNAASPGLRAEARENLPLIFFLATIALTLLTHGRSWTRGAVEKARSATRRGTGIWRFVLSLGLIVLPLLGLWALIQAVFATEMIGLRWSIVLQQLPLWAATLLGIRWLADQVFNADDDLAILALEPGDRRQARRFANALSVLFVLNQVLAAITEVDNYGAETVAVLNFPVLVLSGYFLFRLGQVRNAAPMAGTAAAAEDEGYFRLRFARLLGRIATVIGVIGPIMAAIGYFRVGESLVYPAISTLGLIGLVLVMQRVVNDLYELATGRNAHEADSLVPVLAGFMLVLIALPLLTLIWGARVADLTELWTRFREGFQIGETRFSPTDFLVVAAVFAAGYMLTRLFQGGLRSSVLPKTKIDQGGQNAIVSGVGYIGIFLAAIIAITAGGLDLSSLAIVAGALSVGIGFGLQNIVSNFVSGIILLIERPISEGDWIEVGGQHGTVKDIAVRSTRIETFDKYDLIVPNSDLVSGQVRNYTKGNVLGRIIVPVGVAYGTDTRKVEQILTRIARHHDMVLMNPPPMVYFAGFGADSLDFEIRVILRDVMAGLAVRTEMRHQIVEQFAKEGIEIPFAQRDIWLRNPEVLTGVDRPDNTDSGADVPESDGAGDAAPEGGSA